MPSFYQKGLADALRALPPRGKLHWPMLGKGVNFSADALQDWGPTTIEDTTQFRGLFQNLPARSLCARPTLKHRPTISLSKVAGYVVSLKNKIAERGIYAKLDAQGKPESRSTTKKYGPQEYRPFIPAGKWVPCTSVALMKAMGTWIWSINNIGDKGSSKSNAWQMRALTWYLEKATNLIKTEASKRNIPWGTQRYEDLARALVMPFKDVNGFWQLCIKIATRKDTAGLDKRDWQQKIADLGNAVWDKTKGVSRWFGRQIKRGAKGVVHVAKSGLSYLFSEFGIWIILGVAMIFGVWYYVLRPA